ncbi:TM2 and DnaJ domain-containing protein wurst [Lycorma delicatula]|uniref:TM2 and DnaJ domain-containing protein wurst n=1 Tax=Lycorma delicatula TaxID=130591 RepID=UPI003F50E5D2
MGKSMITTYILWLVGGVFGVHHFYLERDLQGFLWWSTLGGYFGLGWLCDLFLIPQYVADANKEPKYVEKLIKSVRSNKKPPFSSTRFFGMLLVGYLWSCVVSFAIPEEEFGGFSWQWLQILVPLACALGVWSVGNIGHEEGSLWWPLAAAYLTYPLYLYRMNEVSFTCMVFACALAFDVKSKKWRQRVKPRKGVVKRIVIISVCCLLYLSLWMSYLYFNAKFEDSDGEEIPLYEAIHDSLRSPWWSEFKQSLYDTWLFAQTHGWTEAWKQVIDLSEINKEENAFLVLELSSRANQTEINSRCRMLSLRWHPDKVKDEEKTYAKERFYEIQQACELLSSSRSKRRRKNKKFTS